MTAIFLWICKAGIVLYMLTMVVLAIAYCCVSVYRKFVDKTIN
ncbi:hypothetical protein [Parasutterella excrementihominis]|nr:hypothetical protein [Parasutterella excrementihominis]